MSLVYFVGLVAAVGLERTAELVVSWRNAAWAFARGGIEYGAGHYPVMVAVHSGLLLAAPLEVWLLGRAVPSWWWVAALAVAAAQVLRWTCIRTLGRQWNTRVIVVPGLPLVRSGPYRYVSHPNYVAVVVEVAALPLVHGAWVSALVFSALNAALLHTRVRAENRALAGVGRHR